jgi:TlyA family rRNA methyltransferase/putative hemolysin
LARKSRLDALLVARGLAPDLAKARGLIMAGSVVVGEQRVDKPGAPVAEDAPVRVRGKGHDYVSRGALKLVHGLDHFAVPVDGRTCLDLGASTGGFTQVLLERGARRVYAVDVGRDQLAWALRQDARVVSLEQTHARDLTPAIIPEPIDLLVADVSFISLRQALPPVFPLLAAGRGPGGAGETAVRGAARRSRGRRPGARPGSARAHLRRGRRHARGRGVHRAAGHRLRPARRHRQPGVPARRAAGVRASRPREEQPARARTARRNHRGFEKAE